MLNVDLNNPVDVRNAGMKVLREALASRNGQIYPAI